MSLERLQTFMQRIWFPISVKYSYFCRYSTVWLHRFLYVSSKAATHLIVLYLLITYSCTHLLNRLHSKECTNGWNVRPFSRWCWTESSMPSFSEDAKRRCHSSANVLSYLRLRSALLLIICLHHADISGRISTLGRYLKFICFEPI